MTRAQLTLCAVSKMYNGHPVLTEVSFRILAGEHTALLGPSGCGKSTVLRLLAGLEAPSGGEVLMDSQVVSQSQRVLLPPHRRGIAMVFQDLALWPNLSVMDNVLLGLAGAGLSQQERRNRAQEALALCAIKALGDRKPSQISGGQQQRVALARAVAVRPTYLLLDEPFSGLDLVTKAALLKEVSVLAADRQFTIILVTHDPGEATALCHSALVLENGRVQEEGVLEDLLRLPQSETLKAFRSHLCGTESRLGS